MAKKKADKKPVIGRATDEYVQAMVGLRTSNAAGKHADRRTRRARTRAARDARAIKDW